ncbi:MAG: thiamine-phosphate kinase [Phycisphaerae bacterium]
MPGSEDSLVRWLADRTPRPGDGLRLGIGDDMAILERPHSDVLLTSDMLMDGVHFDSGAHTPEQIGCKALAVNLSDCAAMAACPRFAMVSLALPDDWTMERARALFLGMEPLAERFNCRIVGGDTNSWSGRLAVDVTILAEPWPGLSVVRRSGVIAGDAVCVTGRLGGSRMGHHMDFTPRVFEARTLLTTYGPRIHAMMDISDGLSTDADRMARASGVGIDFDADALATVVSDAAETAAGRDEQSALDHALNDGEDFELLFGVAPEALGGSAGNGGTCVADHHVLNASAAGIGSVAFTVVGVAVESPGLRLVRAGAAPQPLEPRGWQHFIA